VHSCRIGYVNNLWTLFAFDPKADGIRPFVFFRVTELKLTDERFTVMHQFDLSKELIGLVLWDVFWTVLYARIST
jgi:predicted DNA-binding transcriptional regulator YafY